MYKNMNSFYKYLKNAVLLSLLTIIVSCSGKPVPNNYHRSEIDFVSLNTDLSVAEQYSQNFNNGVALALAEINNNGGIKGTKLVVNKQDSKGNYITSRNLVYEASKNNTLAVFGTYFTPVASGAAQAARMYKIPFLASSAYTDDIIYKYSNDYTYRLRPGLSQLLDAVALKAKGVGDLNRWMIITYSNNEGKYIGKTFEQELIKANGYDEKNSGFFSWFKKKPLNNNGGMFFTYHYVAPFKAAEYLNVDSTLGKDLALTKAVLIVVNGADIQSIIDSANLKQKLMGKQVFILFAGEPEWFDYTSKDKTPENWITTGYPWYSIDIAAHDDFYFKYWNKYNLQPRYSSLLGYISVYMLAKAASNINLNNPNIIQLREEFNQQLAKIKLETPIGNIQMRKDHQSDMGVYLGSLKIFQQKLSGDNYKGVLLQDIRMQNTQYYKDNQVNIPVYNALKIRAKNKRNYDNYNDKLEEKSEERERKPAQESSYSGKW